jgi:hypothetical protein
VLPRLAGGEPPDGLPRGDTYEELVKSIMAGRECLLDELTGGRRCCQTFASNILGQTNIPMAESLVTAACDAVVQFGSGYFENLLLGLDLRTGGTRLYASRTPPISCLTRGGLWLLTGVGPTFSSVKPSVRARRDGTRGVATAVGRRPAVAAGARSRPRRVRTTASSASAARRQPAAGPGPGAGTSPGAPRQPS